MVSGNDRKQRKEERERRPPLRKPNKFVCQECQNVKSDEGRREAQIRMLREQRHLTLDEVRSLSRFGNQLVSIKGFAEGGVVISRVAGEGIVLTIKGKAVAYIEIVETSSKSCRLKTFAPDTVEVGRSLPFERKDSE